MGPNLYEILTSKLIGSPCVQNDLGGFMDFILTGLIAGAVFIYLFYCLIYPDKF